MATILPPILIFASAIIQTTFLKGFEITPDITLILIMLLANQNGSMKGQVYGFFAGLLTDLLSSGPLGFFAFIYTMTGFISGRFKDQIILDSLFIPVIFAIIGTILSSLYVAFIIIYVVILGTALTTLPWDQF